MNYYINNEDVAEYNLYKAQTSEGAKKAWLKKKGSGFVGAAKKVGGHLAEIAKKGVATEKRGGFLGRVAEVGGGTTGALAGFAHGSGALKHLKEGKDAKSYKPGFKGRLGAGVGTVLGAKIGHQQTRGDIQDLAELATGKGASGEKISRKHALAKIAGKGIGTGIGAAIGKKLAGPTGALIGSVVGRTAGRGIGAHLVKREKSFYQNEINKAINFLDKAEDEQSIEKALNYINEATNYIAELTVMEKAGGGLKEKIGGALTSAKKTAGTAMGGLKKMGGSAAEFAGKHKVGLGLTAGAIGAGLAAKHFLGKKKAQKSFLVEEINKAISFMDEAESVEDLQKSINYVSTLADRFAYEAIIEKSEACNDIEQ